MKHAGPLETEIKLPLADLGAMALALAAAGFEEVHPCAEEVSELWDLDGMLRVQGCALRLRRYGTGALLTWKGARQEHARLKIRPECETAVADPEAMAAILEALGYRPTLRMVKRRALWQRGALEACLDETPFGCYLELEGTAEAIDEALEHLGMAGYPSEPRSYPTLFVAHGCAESCGPGDVAP